MMDQSTIAAIATPTGTGGVGIIKISGPEALTTVAGIFCPGPGSGTDVPVPVNDPLFFSPWKIHYGHIADPAHGRIHDEVIVAVMPGPHSYTREDVVEIQAHGGTVILESILSLLIAKGIRHAQPGEFTRRAFLRGRIDLAQAEAVMDLINANSEAAIDIAFQQAAGSLSASIEMIRFHITGVLATMDAMVDFPDAVEEEMDVADLSATLSNNILEPIGRLIDTYDESKAIREGLRVVIAGAPNVGKSSIMNRLTGSERAIVTEHPGTTRDFLESLIHSGGVPITLVDTAGLRSDPDPVEEIGIEKARQHINAADMVLLVLDAAVPVSREDEMFFAEFQNKSIFIVINKIDLVDDPENIPLPGTMIDAVVVKTSAKQNHGIEFLKKNLVDAVQRSHARTPGRPVPNFRHKALLVEARDALHQAIANVKDNPSPELITIDLRNAHDRLGEITGNTASPDVLDQIFTRYCIGK